MVEAFTSIPNVSVVGEAETQRSAEALLRYARWDVAVLDLQLKEGSGFGVLKSLRQSPVPSAGCVIVFTNCAFPLYRDRSLALGAHHFFVKSREFDRVCEVVAGLAAPASPA